MSADQRAFPTAAGGYLLEGGMTMRQYYKAAAIGGILAVPAWTDHVAPKDLASYAGRVADALLAEDEEKREEDRR